MHCPRCGTAFEGRFCPQCGTPSPASAPTYMTMCGRCGTAFVGRFCPACGTPAAFAYPLPAMAQGTTFRSILSMAWLASMVVFILLLASNFATLGVVSPLIVDGIRTLETGSTANPGFDGDAQGWSFFVAVGNGAGSWAAAGGNPNGYAFATLSATPSSTVQVGWVQGFNTSGSSPFTASLRFDYRAVQNTAQSVSISVFVERVGGRPAGPPAYTIGDASAPAWTPATQVDPFTGELTTRIDIGSLVRDTGTYYLKILVSATFGSAPAGDTAVGLDNVLLRWGTNAALQLFLLIPPVIVATTRDPAPFLAYFGLVAVALVASLLVQVAVDAKPFLKVLRSPPENIGGRLRARIGFTALAQVFLASFFFQVVFIILISLFEVPTDSPLDPAVYPPWFIVFSLANASVFEEIISRVILIGVPLFAASILLRVRWAYLHRGRSDLARYLLGSLRYLYGGNVNRDSPTPTLLAAGALLALSSAVFGFAHGPGYGDWKILPAAVGGLALGYLYLRHGLATAILAHFAQDYFAAIFFAEPVPASWAAAIDIVFLAVLVVGAGFFAYYLWYSVQLLGHIAARFRRPSAVPAGAPWSTAPQTPWPSTPATPYLPYAAPPTAPPPQRPAPVVVPPGYTPPGRPPPYGFAPVQFRCPRCGWIEARYDQGHLTCLRCGQTT